MTAAARKTAEHAVLALEKAYKMAETDDKYNLDVYLDREKEMQVYIELCSSFLLTLGSLAPTGVDKDKLFGGDKRTLGPDAATQLQIHELFLALENLKLIHKLGASDALNRLHSIAMPKLGFHKQSGADFREYGRTLLELYRQLEASIPEAIPPAVKSKPFFSIVFLKDLLLDWLGHGTSGNAVCLRIQTSVLNPADSAVAFNDWFLQAVLIVDDEVNNLNDSLPLPVSAHLILK